MDSGRRRFLAAATAAGLGAGTAALLVAGDSGEAKKAGKAKKGETRRADEDVTPSEDLMREHGVLNRILGIHDLAQFTSRQPAP